MKDKEYIENLIARSLNGNCTSEEILRLRAWIDESLDNRNEYLALKDVWDTTRVQNDCSEEQLSLFYQKQIEKITRSRTRWIKYSSAIAAIVVVGFFIMTLSFPKSEVKSAGVQIYTVPLGSRSSVLLADGTKVCLNSGSELKYSSNFSANERVVSLSGEAFFHVKSDQEHPFIVKTPDFEVKVTGTQFNVCTYSDNKFSSASLAEGHIQLKMNGMKDFIEVNPGEKFKLDRITQKCVIESADIESELAWKDGEFIFKKIPFPDLVQRLERWYDVKLNYSDKDLQNFSFSGRFKNQETIWQVLDALKLISPIDYKKHTFREFTIIYKPLKMK